MKSFSIIAVCLWALVGCATDDPSGSEVKSDKGGAGSVQSECGTSGFGLGGEGPYAGPYDASGNPVGGSQPVFDPTQSEPDPYNGATSINQPRLNPNDLDIRSNLERAGYNCNGSDPSYSAEDPSTSIGGIHTQANSPAVLHRRAQQLATQLRYNIQNGTGGTENIVGRSDQGRLLAQMADSQYLEQLITIHPDSASVEDLMSVVRNADGNPYETSIGAPRRNPNDDFNDVVGAFGGFTSGAGGVSQQPYNPNYPGN